MQDANTLELLPQDRPLPPWSVFFSPIATFNSLSQRPRWLLPLLIAAVYSTAANYYVVTRLGFVRLVARAAHANTSLDPEALLQNALAHQTQIMLIQSVSTFLGVFVTTAAIALILWLVILLFGGDTIYKNVFSVAAHAALLTIVAKETMFILAATVNNDLDSFDLDNPLATNLAFFVHLGSPAAVRIFSHLDVITISNLVLIALGLPRVARGLRPATSFMVVMLPWVIYVVVTSFITITPS